MKYILILLLLASCRESSYTIIIKSDSGYKIHDAKFRQDTLFKNFEDIESYYKTVGWKLGYPVGYDRYTITKIK